MIVSDVHRYVFIELPQTGSSSISRELLRLYDGRKILKKHATYRDFLRQADERQKQYFAFAGIRNPLDRALSLYFKLKTDHRKHKNAGQGYGSLLSYQDTHSLVARLIRRQFLYTQEEDSSFAGFFKRFYRLPYNDWSCLDHHRLDYLIRFEALAEDFAEALRRIGIEPRRPLPVTNKTRGRSRDFWSYYPPELHARARWIFAPYCKRWGYEFPREWGGATSWSSEAAFRTANLFRGFYWRYVR